MTVGSWKNKCYNIYQPSIFLLLTISTVVIKFYVNGIHLASFYDLSTVWYFSFLISSLTRTFIYIYIYIYIYVWELNQTVLELDFWAVKFVFFPRRDLNSHHWYTAEHHSLSLTSNALDNSTTSAPYIYIYYIYIPRLN